MKKKILLMLCMVAFVACLFVVSVSAADKTTFVELDSETGFGLNFELGAGTAKVAGNREVDFSIVDGNVVIPSTFTYNGVEYTVTEINGSSFGSTGSNNNTSIISVTIPDTVTSIGSHAFRNCSNLESAEIGSGVTKLVDATFYACSKLTTVTFNGTPLSAIEGNVFTNCSGLVGIDLPLTIKTIGGSAFQGCSALQTIAFPEGLETISASAFRGCKSMSPVTLPSTLKTIGSYAFYGCSGINGKIVITSDMNFNLDAFRECANLTELEICTVGATNIPAHAFYQCSNLVKITLPTTITTFGNNCFDGCNKLKSIVGPDMAAITSYGGSCFKGCNNLEFTVSPVATYFGSSAFWGCRKLTGDIVLSSNTTEVGDHAFRETAITSIVIRMSDESTQRSFNNANFYGCSALKYAVIPDNITTFGGHAFYGCGSLEYIVIGNVTSVNSGTAFSGCNNLKAIITTASMENASASWVGKYSITADSLAPFADYTHGTLPSSRTVFYGATTCSDCNGLLGEEGFVFGDFLTGMGIGQQCTHCGVKTLTSESDAVFVDMGYSVACINGSFSIMQGFKVNYVAFDFYNENAAVAIDEIGVLAVADFKVEDKAFNELGEALNGVITYVSDARSNLLQIKVTGLSAEGTLADGTSYLDAKLHLCAYVKVGNKIYYVSDEYVGETLGEAVSYNDKAE